MPINKLILEPAMGFAGDYANKAKSSLKTSTSDGLNSPQHQICACIYRLWDSGAGLNLCQIEKATQINRSKLHKMINWDWWPKKEENIDGVLQKLLALETKLRGEQNESC